jgi:Flp pilus assembly pilin Flp
MRRTGPASGASAQGGVPGMPRSSDLNERGESSMRNEFLKDEKGQDLVEYTLLLAFVCLVGVGFYIGVGQGVSGIWSIVNKQLSATVSNGS